MATARWMRLLAVCAWTLAGLATMSTATAGDPKWEQFFEVDKKGEPKRDKAIVGTDDAPLVGKVTVYRDKKKGQSRQEIKSASLEVAAGVRVTLQLGPQHKKYLDDNRPANRDDVREIAVVGILSIREKNQQKTLYMIVKDVYDSVTGTLAVDDTKKKAAYTLTDKLGGVEYPVEPGKSSKDFKRWVEQAKEGGESLIFGTFSPLPTKEKKKKDKDKDNDEAEEPTWQFKFWKSPNMDEK